MKLAEEARRISPGATQSTLIAAHFFHAAKDLRRSDPKFDEYCKKYERPLGITYLVAVAASEPSPLRQTVLNHPGMRAALELVEEEVKTFPNSISPLDWALLQNIDPAAGDKAADTIRATPWQVSAT